MRRVTGVARRPAGERGYGVAGRVVVVDAARPVHNYVARFFGPVAGTAGAGLAIRVRRAGARASGVDYFLAGQRSGELRVPIAEESVAVRKIIRAWDLTRPDEVRRGILHAAAFVSDSRTFAVLGPPQTGKTTLLLDAVLTHRFVGLANDALAVDDSGEPRVANVPSVIGVRPDTLRCFAEPLRALTRHQAPTTGPRDDGSRYYYPDCLLPALAGWRPVTGRRTTVVAIARFARPGEPASVTPVAPQRVCATAAAELAAWPLGREVDQLAAGLGGVPWQVVAARSMAVLDRLLANVILVELVHHGTVAPLLEFAHSQKEQTCR
jgi:hypothetical protein